MTDLPDEKDFSENFWKALRKTAEELPCPDCDAKDRRIRELKQQVAECEPYLKDGESPAECIQRNRDDAARALKMLAEEKRLRKEAHVVSPETIAAIKCVTGQNEELADD